MSNNAPTAAIVINGAVEKRDVCGVNIRTRGDGGNTVRLAGGVDLKVDDEYAAAVIAAYYDEVSENE